MAYILRSMACIGAIYAMSPVDTRDPSAPALAPASLSAAATVVRQIEALDQSGLKDALALGGDAARLWASLDPQTRQRLLDLIAEQRKASGDTLSKQDRGIPWQGQRPARDPV